MWAIVASTTRVSAILEGYAPGVATWFRAMAIAATTRAPSSAAVSIYAPIAPAVPLRLA